MPRVVFEAADLTSIHSRRHLMRYCATRRPDRRWSSSWLGGPAIGLSLSQQPVVENLEGRFLLANIHFVGNPVAVANPNGSVTVSGKLAGLGDNQSITVDVSVPVTFTVECRNPGGNIAPGQTHTGTLTGTGTFTSDKNGNVVFSVTTAAPTASPEDCPNPKWTPIITDVTYGDVTVTAGGVTKTAHVQG